MKKTTPILKAYVWGGEKLKRLFKRESNEKIAESWELSVHPDGPSGTADGGTLRDFLAANPSAISPSGGDLPVLVKYIDAKQKLSVQVHPNDEYARAHENDDGKTEAWYIAEAEDGAGIYCGFKRDVTRAEVRRKLRDGSIEELLNFVPVKAGDCFLIKAGTVHAICSGCVICEVQQSSNVTYRVYDYGRLGADGKPRALHTQKAFDVMNLSAFKDETNGGDYERTEGGKIRLLTSCKYFEFRELALDGEYSELNRESFTAASVVRGSGKINGKEFSCGDTFFVSCGEKFTLDGKATVLLTSKPKKRCFAGIDLGGTGIKCGLVTEDGEIVATKKRPTRKNVAPIEIIKDMAELVRSLERETGLTALAAGVGCPGVMNQTTGNVVYSNNLDWKDVPLISALGDLLKIPVFAENDANAAALGEHRFGAGKAYESIVLLTLGTGVGGGVVSNGKLFTGTLGAGVELGHEVIRRGGEKCTCGRRGCLEAYASATALVSQARRAVKKNPQSLVLKKANGDEKAIDGKIVLDSAREGDATAKKVVARYIDYLADGVTNVVNVFRPEAVLLGGGICAAGDLLLKPLRRKVNRRAYGGMGYAPVKIEVASLGNDAGIYGAAAVAASGLEALKRD